MRLPRGRYRFAGRRPWLETHIPGAPIDYVELPRMRGVDEPVREDLPAFESRLADALERAAREGRPAEQFGRLGAFLGVACVAR